MASYKDPTFQERTALAQAEKSAARKAAIVEAKEAKRAAAQAPVKPGLSEAEQKAARDERYAARKKRKG